MTPDERSNEDMLMDMACDRIRELEAQLGNERRLKNEVLGRLEKVVQEKHGLETRVALLEADLKRARHVSPVESREVKAPWVHLGPFSMRDPGPEKVGPECFGGSDYFVEVGK
jgi:hypothetical protein